MIIQAAHPGASESTGGRGRTGRVFRRRMSAKARLIVAAFGVLTLLQTATPAVVHANSALPGVGNQSGSASWAQGLYPDGSIAYCTMNWSLTESPTSQSYTNVTPVQQLTLTASGNCAYSTYALGIYINAPGWVDSAGNACVGAQVAYNSSGWGVGPGSCYLRNPMPGSQGGTVTFSASSDGVSAYGSTLVLP
jgi:hypothetical protein